MHTTRQNTYWFCDRMMHAIGIEAKAGMTCLRSTFTDDERKMLIARLSERYNSWSRHHRIYITNQQLLEETNYRIRRVMVDKTIIEHYRDRYRSDYSDPVELEEAVREAVEGFATNQSFRTANDAVTAVMDTECCTCPGFVPLTIDEMLGMAAATHNLDLATLTGVST
jgi:hypothetical protein